MIGSLYQKCQQEVARRTFKALPGYLRQQVIDSFCDIMSRVSVKVFGGTSEKYMIKRGCKQYHNRLIVQLFPCNTLSTEFGGNSFFQY